MQKISDALYGCLEIPLFLKAGAERFSDDAQAVALSFLISFLLLPLSAALALVNPDFQDRPFWTLLFKFTLEFLISTALYLPALYFISRKLNRAQYFFRFVTASNWLNLSQFILFLPLVFPVQMGHWRWDEVYNFLIFLVMYGYAYTAFLITYTFRINWMLATSLSILGMAIGDFTHFLVY